LLEVARRIVVAFSCAARDRSRAINHWQGSHERQLVSSLNLLLPSTESKASARATCGARLIATAGIADAILGNVGTMVSFQVRRYGRGDSREDSILEFSIEDLVNLPNYQIYLKLMIDRAVRPKHRLRAIDY
jgi:hypothetical protein